MSTTDLKVSAEVLFEVLSFMKRSELDYLESTSKYLNHFITKLFSTFPFHKINWLDIGDGASQGISFRDCS
uniref:F-box domain-containing protein n=1 Tax=Ditylenchus dipsaci TaxID=166011 RepID=A0A915CTD7_9BILA